MKEEFDLKTAKQFKDNAYSAMLEHKTALEYLKNRYENALKNYNYYSGIVAVLESKDHE